MNTQGIEAAKGTSKISREEVSYILESVLDTLMEVGNGVTDHMLQEAADDLLKFRDQWLRREMNAQIREILRHIVENGCEEENDMGDVSCFFCGADIGNEEPHTDNCAYERARHFLEP